MTIRVLYRYLGSFKSVLWNFGLFDVISSETIGTILIHFVYEANYITTSGQLERHLINKDQSLRYLISPSLCPLYRIAGNIGGEFNLADWRICESTAKLNSAKQQK